MEKRTIVAIGICLLFVGAYPFVMERLYPDYYKKQKQARTTKAVQSTASSEGAPVSSTVLKADDFLPENDVVFNNPKLKLVFSQTGGGIREALMPAYTNTETKKPLTFISMHDSKAAPTSIGFLEPSNVPARYQGEAAGPNIVMRTEAESLRVTKEYVFRDNGYGADLVVRFENKTASPVPVRYEIFAGSRLQPRNSIDAQYIEANLFSVANGKPSIKHIKESKAGKEVPSSGPVKWVAVKDRHFSVIVRPEKETFTGLVRGLGDHQFSASLVSAPFSVPPGGVVEEKFLVYIGPNDVHELLPYELSEIVNFGKLDLIGKLLVGTLEMLHKVFRNYGLAIIALTLLINLFLFPLTRVSYMSMKRMQLIQPQMTKLREHHKKNPEKLNREMMELYKKHKVNPFGGCLPMILQMPVFIALYIALSKSVILINEKLLWIQDLSAPDKVYLPLSLPFLGNVIHILPLIMCAAMFIQQRLTQVTMAGQDPAMAAQQKMMTFTMPIIFGFIFYSMPAGLVIYWLTNTLFMTAYQLRLKGLTLEK